MNEENNKNGTVSTLEDLLQIDDANKTNGDKAPEPESLLVATKHTFVTSPWSRLAIIAVPFGVGFLAIFLMLNGVFNPAPAPKIALKTQIPTTEETQQSNDGDGDGDARAKLALSDQADELNKINIDQKEQPAQVKVSQTQKAVPSTPQNSSDSIEKIRPRWQAASKVNKITLANNYLPQESQILQGKQTRYLTVGSFATGVIVTPLVQDTVNNSGQTQTPTPNNTKSIARLTQDLHDNYGQVAIPSGTLLAVELASVDGGSYAIASVRAIIKDNTEYPISAGAISVTGEGGRPLLARRFQDRGGEIARNDLFSGAVSALGKVGEIMNQPDNEEEIEDEFTGRIRRRSSGNQRNLTGALMSGFFGQVSQNISQRNQRATQEILSRPNAWFIPQGTKVTFNVNRSLELPSETLPPYLKEGVSTGRGI
ncbi:TrbI/VirB10 family protein [Nostoc sp. CHAB 5836]|uniref:TrbI/VirB10 family protein n=1 Tax=Nostoc sp. CHAB 5836 TaxID=2780404 RepID=UPI001E4AD9A9|nr:TrbI/VirB10 family protein [Nostoc sp. CHAB 5836]MCC5616750.1 TrbI/VirB10 family protein [Nostoc sp. CHAB 5836]